MLEKMVAQPAPSLFPGIMKLGLIASPMKPIQNIEDLSMNPIQLAEYRSSRTCSQKIISLSLTGH